MMELFYNLWYHDLNINNKIKIELLRSGITPSEFWTYKQKDYINLGIDLIKSEDIDNSKHLKKYENLCEYVLKEKIHFILYTDTCYPDSLKNMYDPPVGLFIKGIIPQLKNPLSVVGARRASEYGKTVSYKFSYELGGKGITIISGMARGIDSCAHRGCIDGGGTTIAVLGSGFKNIYPPENRELFNQISEHGCIITEYMPDTPPLSINFPRRNRIISGLAKYILVIEAGERSGSLITASLALEQGKDVFAVPGNIFSPNSKGTNRLVRDGAKIITEVNDIFEEYGIINKTAEYSNLNDFELSIINLLKNGGIDIDHIINDYKIESQHLLAVLTNLECRGIVRRVYGNYYIIT